MQKFDIRKSFEIFWREPLSILKEGLFQIVNIQSAENIFEKKPAVNIDFMKDGRTQITVVDSDKMYQLFQTVLLKQRLKESQKKALITK
ncbi:MAG: hypothetical protein VZR09_05030 [Candidatus Gastranaerophilaceae bacterium]|nr:hypothetical protein [Candidatus Gastranaerophilaceae bacterium]